MKIKNVAKEVKTLISIARTADLKKAAIPFYDALPAWCFPERDLRFKAYGVGMAKTGTVFISRTFHKAQYRCIHEPESRFLINKILAFYNGKIDTNGFTRYVKHRDRRLGLEMDVSHLNYHLLDVLVKEFSEAKFILTIRDCYSWVDSIINHWLANPKILERRWWGGVRARMADNWFKPGRFEHAKEEKILADKGLYTLDGYFSHWNEHNSKVLATVPEGRLLIVKTREIDQNIPIIEEFLEIAPGTLPHNIPKNVRRRKFNLLSQIDRDFLEEKANFHCKELMDIYFPEVKGLRS